MYCNYIKPLCGYVCVMKDYSAAGESIFCLVKSSHSKSASPHTKSRIQARALTSGPLISISSRETPNSLERDLVLLVKAWKMTYLMHVNVIYTLGLTNEYTARLPKLLLTSDRASLHFRVQRMDTCFTQRVKRTRQVCGTKLPLPYVAPHRLIHSSTTRSHLLFHTFLFTSQLSDSHSSNIHSKQ